MVPDFERSDTDIAEHALQTTQLDEADGGIIVIRSDGRDLWSQDIAALAEFVGKKLPQIKLYATRRGWVGPIRLGAVTDMRKKWNAASKYGYFASRWFDWRKKKVKMGFSDYADLECPVVGAVAPELHDSKVDRLKDAAKDWKEKACAVQ